jgi:hypothetical protein
VHTQAVWYQHPSPHKCRCDVPSMFHHKQDAAHSLVPRRTAADVLASTIYNVLGSMRWACWSLKVDERYSPRRSIVWTNKNDLSRTVAIQTSGGNSNNTIVDALLRFFQNALSLKNRSVCSVFLLTIRHLDGVFHQ